MELEWKRSRFVSFRVGVLFIQHSHRPYAYFFFLNLSLSLFLFHSCLASVIAACHASVQAVGTNWKGWRLFTRGVHRTVASNPSPYLLQIWTWISTFPRKSYNRGVNDTRVFPLSPSTVIVASPSLERGRDDLSLSLDFTIVDDRTEILSSSSFFFSREGEITSKK